VNILRIAWLYLRIGVMTELEYRTNFGVQLLQMLISLGIALSRLWVIFYHTDSLGGWSADEMLALVGVYFLVLGLINLFIQPNMTRILTDVRKGTLDFILTKPEDSQLLVSVRAVDFWRFVEIGMGLALIVVALVRLRETVGPAAALGFGVALLAGGAIVYSFLLILTTCSFWFVRVENILVIFQSMYEAGRWPVGIYPAWLQFALTSLVPIAFAVTVPASALTDRLNPRTLTLALGIALALLLGSRWFWRFGLRHYSGASA
jgi:ABC-2 type transport system permease protein